MSRIYKLHLNLTTIRVLSWKAIRICYHVLINSFRNKNVSKGKGHPRIGHEGLEGEWKYDPTLFSTWALGGVDGQHRTPAAKDRVPIV
jgi:hypothetical protein